MCCLSQNKLARGKISAIVGFVLLCMLSLAPPPSYAADRSGGIGELMLRKHEISEKLARQVASCVGQKDTDHIAFRGCIDWHSAVHGVWALLAYTNATGDQRHVALISHILTPENISGEHEYIKKHPHFEMPYGRAWFLRTTLAYETAFESGALQPMADDIFQSLLDHYENSPIEPTSKSYDSASWALLNMWDYAQNRGNEAALTKLRSWTTKHFAYDGATCPPNADGTSFMAVCTNWAWLASRVLDTSQLSAWLQNFFSKSGLPRPVTKPRNWHHYGQNFSRAWGLWALYQATGEYRYASAYTEHFQRGYEPETNWAGDYKGVGHWVAQFGMLAVTPLF